MPDTAMSIAAPNAVIHLRREYPIPGDPMWPGTWGGLEPDKAASAAAVNQSPGVPIVLEQWGKKREIIL